MDRITSDLESTESPSNSKIGTTNIQHHKMNSGYNYRNFFRRKPLPPTSTSAIPSSSTSLSSLLTRKMSTKSTKINYAVLVLTILLGLIANSLSSPVFVDNPSIAQFQSGRNIRHLPCIVRKSGLSGTCMFAIDCIKQNGTHLGTCIDRFYFGSCCRIKEDFYAQDISDNSIDQNTISHYLNDVNTTPSISGLHKSTTQQQEQSSSNLHKSKPTVPVPYVPISTVIPSMQNRENIFNSSSTAVEQSNEIPILLNDPKIEIISSSQTQSVSSTSLTSSSSSVASKLPQHSQHLSSSSHKTQKPSLQTQNDSITTETSKTQSSQSLTSSLSSLPSTLSHTTNDKHRTTSLPTKHIHTSNRPTVQHSSSSSPTHKQSSTHKTSANEVLKETPPSDTKTPYPVPTKLTHHTKQTTAATTASHTNTYSSNHPTAKPSSQPIPMLTTFYPPLLMADNHVKDTTESVKFTTFQMVETTTFAPTTTTAFTTKFETKKPTTVEEPTKTPSPIIYVSNKPLHTKRPLTTHRTKVTKRPTSAHTTKSSGTTGSTTNKTRAPTTTTRIETTTRKTSSKPPSKPIIVTKRPLTTRPPISTLTTTVNLPTPITTNPPFSAASTKRTDLYKTDSTTTVKPSSNSSIVTGAATQSTKAPRPKPKPTGDIVRVPPTTIRPFSNAPTIKITTLSSSSAATNSSKVNITTSPTTTAKPLPLSSSSFPTKLHATQSPSTYQTSLITSISSTQITTTNSPLTTLKPFSLSSSTQMPFTNTTTSSKNSSKQPLTTKQPSASKPHSTRFPTTRPSVARPSSTTTYMPSSTLSSSSSTSSTSQKPSSTSSTTKPTALPSSSKPIVTTKQPTGGLSIITKHPLTTRPPLTSTTPTTKKPIALITKHPLTTRPPVVTTVATEMQPSTPTTSTPLQVSSSSSSTTMKPSGLVTWTNMDNAPSKNASTSTSNTSDKIEEDWQPKPLPEWAMSSSTIPTVEANKTVAVEATSSAKPSESTTEDVIASSISSVLEQLNNQSASNETHTTHSPWVWSSETKQNASSTLTSIMEGLANISNTTTSVVEGYNNVTSSTTPSPIPSLEGMDYKQLCGKRMYPEPRIVGGANAAFGRWPWQISLRQWRTSTYLHKCGAALLNENWAITAAHCVDNVPPSDLLLRLGEYDLAEEEEPYSYQERRVQIVASHPQFDPRTFEYDLALLRFYEPVIFQPNIIPVCVPDNDYDFLGDTAYVTGWGRLYEDGPLPSVLQEVSVPVINNTICETMYRAAGYIEHIPHIFICAGWKKGGYDSCEGDSGGPMVLQRERDKRFVLGGVISWGIGCAEPNQPGVYTRISEFRDWINQILQF